MNKIISVGKDGVESPLDSPTGLVVEWLGENACLKIGGGCRFRNCKFQIASDDLIEIGANSNVSNLYIRCAATLSQVKIGQHFIISSGEFILPSGGVRQSIVIGDECLFSSHIAIFTSDGHSILDKETDRVLNNKGGHIRIGNHCWVGYRTLFTKSASVANGSVVGANSLICKNFLEESCLIAGQPATVRRGNINWSIQNPSVYKEFHNEN